MSAEAVASSNDVVAAFYEKLRRLTHKAVCGREFVRVPALLKWMKDDRTGSRLFNLIRALCGDKDNTSNRFLPLGYDGVEIFKNGCLLLIIALILDLRRSQPDLVGSCEDLLKYFSSIAVIHNPESLSQLKIKLEDVKREAASSLGNVEIFVREFKEKRWKYCPARLNNSSTLKWKREIILPIVRQRKVSGLGGTASLRHIYVPEDLVHENLRRGTNQIAEFVDPNTKEKVQCHRFVVKTVTEKQNFDNEVEAYRYLKDHDNWVQCLGAFRYDYLYMDQRTSRDITQTWNILFESGAMDLQEYFSKARRPLGHEILDIWRYMIGLVQGLEYMHYSRRRDGDIEKESYGWHCDIKPENILLATMLDSKEWCFKLADPGFSNFLLKEEWKGQPSDRPHRKVEGGTAAFAPPERYSSPGDSVYQSIDTWALGAVFSIFATWIIRGREGVDQYTIYRGKAIKQLNAANPRRSPNMQLNCFHDGKESVLPAVLQWHDLLREHCHEEHYIIRKILKFVEKEMLIQDPLERASAWRVHQELESILEKAERKWRIQESRFTVTHRILNEIADVCPPYPSQVEKEGMAIITRLLQPAMSGSPPPSEDDLDLAPATPEDPGLQGRPISEHADDAIRTALPQHDVQIERPPVASPPRQEPMPVHDEQSSPDREQDPVDIPQSVTVGYTGPASLTKEQNEIIECCTGTITNQKLDRFKELRAQDPQLLTTKDIHGWSLPEILFTKGRKIENFLSLARMLLEADGVDIEFRERLLNDKAKAKLVSYRRWLEALKAKEEKKEEKERKEKEREQMRILNSMSRSRTHNSASSSSSRGASFIKKFTG